MSLQCICCAGRTSESGDALSHGNNAHGSNTASLHGISTPTVLWLYVTLTFPPDTPETASRFEVFYRFGAMTGSDANKSTRDQHTPNNQGWVWLGTASAHQFRVTQMELPVGLARVDFAVQAADVLGKLVPFQDATFATLERP